MLIQKQAASLGSLQKKCFSFAFLAQGFHPWFTVLSLLAPVKGSWCEGHHVCFVLSEREWGGVCFSLCSCSGSRGVQVPPPTPRFCARESVKTLASLFFHPLYHLSFSRGWTILKAWFRISGRLVAHLVESFLPTPLLIIFPSSGQLWQTDRKWTDRVLLLGESLCWKPLWLYAGPLAAPCMWVVVF